MRWPWWLLACACLLAGGCLRSVNGTGEVSGVFFVPECRPSGALERGEYRFDARGLSTQRFEDTLSILVQEYAVDVEETDGLTIRIPDVQPLRTSTEAVVREPIVRGSGGVNAALNLYVTCPSQPTLHAVSGELVLDEFSIADDPEDTGVEEKIVGTLTATVVSAGPDVTAGTIRAEFDFVPNRRPLGERL